MAGEGCILALYVLLLSPATLASTLQCCGSLLSVLMLQRLGQRQYIVQICIWRAFTRDTSRPRTGGLPHLQVFTRENATPAGRVSRSARPHLSCKREAEKIKVYMDRRCTPPPCKQALKLKFHMITVIVTRSLVLAQVVCIHIHPCFE